MKTESGYKKGKDSRRMTKRIRAGGKEEKVLKGEKFTSLYIIHSHVR